MEAAATTAAAEKPIKRVETLSMQVDLLHGLHLPVMYSSPNKFFAICSLFQTLLIIDKGLQYFYSLGHQVQANHSLG